VVEEIVGDWEAVNWWTNAISLIDGSMSEIACSRQSHRCDKLMALTFPRNCMMSFTYQLTSSGWALATIANGQAEMKIPASYLCDALRDFVDAVRSLFVTDRAQCVWEEEPGEVRWEFRRDVPT
jgi:hypothetical protein